MVTIKEQLESEDIPLFFNDDELSEKVTWTSRDGLDSVSDLLVNFSDSVDLTDTTKKTAHVGEVMIVDDPARKYGYHSEIERANGDKWNIERVIRKEYKVTIYEIRTDARSQFT